MQDSHSAAGVKQWFGMNADQFIAARVSCGTKQRFRALAMQQQLSESALLKRLVDMALHSAGDIQTDALDRSPQRARGARLYVRLQPDDRLLLAERTAARHLPGATYVCILVRAHLRRLAPLPKDELLALKRSIAELAAIGRLLNQGARAANQGGGMVEPSRERVSTMLNICEGLRDHVTALISKNLLSWTEGHTREHL